MLVLGEQRFPSVVLFRDQRRRPDELARLLIDNLEEIEYSLTEGAIAARTDERSTDVLSSTNVESS
jgi:hypothetical protein